jgi:hypothetical protein
MARTRCVAPRRRRSTARPATCEPIDSSDRFGCRIGPTKAHLLDSP